MIEAKESLIGNINASDSLQGSLNKAIEYVSPTTQEKSITPTKEVQEVKADSGIFALSKVIVEAIPDEYKEVAGTIDINVNGTYDVANYESANVNVSGDVELEASYRSLLDSTLGANTTKLPSDLTSVGNYAFAYRTNLEITELPDTITSIGEYAFRNCTNLALNELPSNLTRIDSRAFYYCSKINFNKIPDSVTNIGVYVFSYCTSLERVEFSNKISIIPEGCFGTCSNLKYFKCYQSVSSVGYNAFGNTALETFIIRRTTPPSLNTTSFKNTPIAGGTGYIYVPDEAINTYKSATNWSAYSEQIKGVSELE